MSRTTDRDEVHAGESVSHFLTNPIVGDRNCGGSLMMELKPLCITYAVMNAMDSRLMKF